MLCLGIDQHARQLTISFRNDDGDAIQARQDSNKPEKVQAFVDKLSRERVRSGSTAMAGSVRRAGRIPARKAGQCPQSSVASDNAAIRLSECCMWRCSFRAM